MSDFDDSLEARELMKQLKDMGETTQWGRPPDRVWQAIENQTGIAQQGVEPVPEQHGDADATLRPARFDRRTALLVAAGVITGALGTAAGLSLLRRDTPEDVVQQAVLSPLEDSDKDLGRAWLVRESGQLWLRVETTPIERQPGHYIEVWLINRDLARMVTVGILSAGDRGMFPIDDAVIQEGYVIVDLSIEPFDDQPAHSGNTVMRGALRG